MAENPDKAALIAQLAAARESSHRSLTGLAAALNVPQRFQKSVRRNQTAWLAGAGIAGWVLSRLPARRKKVKVVTEKSASGLGREVKEVAAAGLLLTLGKLAFSLFRPALTKLLTQKLSDLADDYLAQRASGTKGGRQPGVRTSSVR